MNFDPKFLQFQIRKHKSKLSELETSGNYAAARACVKQLEALQQRLHAGLVNYHKELKKMEDYGLWLKQRRAEMFAWFDHVSTYDETKSPSDIRGFMIVSQHHSNDIVSEFTAIDDCKDLLEKGYIMPQVSLMKKIPVGYRAYAIRNNGILVLLSESLDDSD
jgi:hypothetical protein